MTLFIDTNVASRLYNATASEELVTVLEDEHAVLPFVVPAEMLRGAFKARWGDARTRKLRGWLSEWPVAYPNQEVVDAWAAIVATSDHSGRNIAHNDAWIAACCLAGAMPLATFNRKHFEWIERLEVLP